jgi:hypothetical protein
LRRERAEVGYAVPTLGGTLRRQSAHDPNAEQNRKRLAASGVGVNAAGLVLMNRRNRQARLAAIRAWSGFTSVSQHGVDFH